MPNFGISSFLKILHLNEKPQKTEIRKRLNPSDGGGYDFHGSVRRLCADLALNNADPRAVIERLKDIKKVSERDSARTGLQAFIKWKNEHPAQFVMANNVIYNSPKSLFKLTFKPNFSLITDDKVAAVHIWNTARPALDDHLVRAVLSVFPALYTVNKPDDLAVLCLRSKRLIRLGEPDPKIQELGILLIKKVDKIITDLNESGDGKPYDTGDHPTPPFLH
ncbi:hypothetical protein [Brucella haematophila]|nr:hypothetical protein [Brucella haematophila]TMU89369.1 hypothetical protein FGI60_23535 [Brucella haematophila]